MEYNEIKNLLTKYLAGETSPEEEKALSEYFAQADIPADLEEWKPLFAYFSSEKNLTASEDFDQKILGQIRQRQHPAKNVRLFGRRAMAAAAAIILLLGITGVVYKLTEKIQPAAAPSVAQTMPINNNAPTEIKDTYNNPEDAKKAVEENLTILSTKLNENDMREMQPIKINDLN